MKLTTDFIVNIKSKEVEDKIKKASQLGIRDVVADIWNDAIKNAPYRKTQPRISTGHNARSITAEVSGMGVVRRGKDSEPEKVVDDSKLEGAVYSTSGYGGWLEVGTHRDDGAWRMSPRPYFYPALVKNMHNLPAFIKRHLA